MNHTEKPHPLEPELVTTGGARSLDDTQTHVLRGQGQMWSHKRSPFRSARGQALTTVSGSASRRTRWRDVPPVDLDHPRAVPILNLSSAFRRGDTTAPLARICLLTSSAGIALPSCCLSAGPALTSVTAS